LKIFAVVESQIWKLENSQSLDLPSESSLICLRTPMSDGIIAKNKLFENFCRLVVPVNLLCWLMEVSIQCFPRSSFWYCTSFIWV